VPFVVLSYYNPILAMGLDHFLRKACESGVDGIVVPDLPVEEGDEFRNLALKHNIDNIYLVAPNTSNTRLRTVLDKSKGFLYLVSLYGVTGPRDSLSPQALETVKKVKSLARGKVPVSAGFGVSQPEHVSAIIRSGADGAIVGSALVNIVSQHLESPNEAPDHLKSSVAKLKASKRKSGGGCLKFERTINGSVQGPNYSRFEGRPPLRYHLHHRENYRSGSEHAFSDRKRYGRSGGSNRRCCRSGCYETPRFQRQARSAFAGGNIECKQEKLPSALHGRHKDPGWQEAWDVKTLHSDTQ